MKLLGAIPRAARLKGRGLREKAGVAANFDPAPQHTAGTLRGPLTKESESFVLARKLLLEPGDVVEKTFTCEA